MKLLSDGDAVTSKELMMKQLIFKFKRNVRHVLTAMSVLFISVMNFQANAQQVARLIRYEVNAGAAAEFRKAISSYVMESLKDPSNILSEAYQEEADSSVLWIIERWNRKESLDKSDKSRSFGRLQSLSAGSLKQPAKIILVKDLEPLSKQQWRMVARKDDRPITIMLFVDAKQGAEHIFKEVYHKAMPAFRGEPGVINYQLSQLEDDSTQFVTYEKFRDEAAFQYHLNFPPIQPVIDFLNTNIKKQPFQSGLHRLIEFAPLTRQQ
ncbi:MAG: antibiotic biosynthesis monooxygenase family protein [Chitinophagaceae bacterium]